MRKKGRVGRVVLHLLFLAVLPSCLLFEQGRILPEPSFPPRVEVFELPGGNLGNRVRDIVQDSVGFLWFTSSYGLHRYDGYGVRTYLHDPSDTTTISAHLPFCLHIARDGSLWAGTYNQLGGLCQYDYATETFAHFRHEAPEEESLTNAPVNAITDDLARNGFSSASMKTTILRF